MTDAERIILFGGNSRARLSFSLPLQDLGAGVANLVLDVAAGSATPTYSRTSVAWTKLANGLWAEVATGVPRFRYLGRHTSPTVEGGYLSEPAGTQLVTPTASIRSMSDASWAKVNVTCPANNAIGIDGVANSASTITATANNGTILQTLTAAASARTYSAFVRRKVGTGTLTIQQGATTLDVTAQINSVTYTRVELNASVLNSAFGFTIGTSGDSFEVDFNQFEALASTQFASSPMATSGAARAADVLTYAVAGNLDLTKGTASAVLSTDYTQPPSTCIALCATDAGRILFSPGNNPVTVIGCRDGTTTATKTGLTSLNSGARKRASSWGAAGIRATGDGAVPATAVFDGTMGTGSELHIGHSAGSQQYSGTINGVQIFASQKTDTQLQIITTPDPWPYLYVGDGDSLTKGFSAGAGTGGDYVTQLVTLLGRQWEALNFGVGGQGSPQMTADAPTEIDPLLTSLGRSRNVLGAWDVTNSLASGASAATSYSDYVTYCQARQAAGWKVVAFTVLPRSDVGIPGTFETDRQTVNTNIRANWATFADALADVAADTRIGDSGDELDLTYYVSDKVHMTAAGYGVVAGVVNTAVLSIQF